MAQGNDSGPFVGDSGVSRQRDTAQEPKVTKVQPPAAHVSSLTEISHLSDTRTPKWVKMQVECFLTAVISKVRKRGGLSVPKGREQKRKQVILRRCRAPKGTYTSAPHLCLAGLGRGIQDPEAQRLPQGGQNSD